MKRIIKLSCVRAKVIPPPDCASYLSLVYPYCQQAPPPSPYGYGELLPRPSDVYICIYIYERGRSNILQ